MLVGKKLKENENNPIIIKMATDCFFNELKIHSVKILVKKMVRKKIIGSIGG